ncbi:MAG TPA: 23S rRNA methyltransferase [Rhodospirillaceae bacterium]|nr:23S rRNA methyltransferase [Magnetovibrio sp.]HBT43298.1 23S rRNA methyltransferase [Rhodospirillaceae bacterium]HCS70373.1 23S rRNA methyltransferase [Rhodospirillaceae bacterium]|tara:strand:- start:3225 stop:3989 length:765 start_codon:yes stop_codon:yes gene_type:complete
MSTGSGKSGSGRSGSGRPGTTKTRTTQFSGRGLHNRVKTAKGRKTSSKMWLERQLNDPYVAEAKARGYRSRAAFKLLELDSMFGLLKKGARVVDLGAAPGGWTQVAVDAVGAGKGPKGGQVVAIDIQGMDPVQSATVILQDFMDPDAPDRIKDALTGPADLVLSDMAAPATGHRQTDHLRIMGLCEAAFDFACEVLAPGGGFVAKVLKGGTENELLAQMKRRFAMVKHAKPPASRADSAESYVVATGFRPDPKA